MRLVSSLVISLLVAALAASGTLAQGASVAARIGAGQTVSVKAAPVDGEGVLLEFALPNGQAQSFPQLGEAMVPIDGTPAGRGLLARDLNGDGVDEVLIRSSVPPDRGAMLVFRWDRTTGEYVPIEFTDDRDRTTKYLVVDPKEPVVLNGNGIEVQFVTTRPDGRKSSHVARYRWNGQAFTQSTDN